MDVAESKVGDRISVAESGHSLERLTEDPYVPMSGLDIVKRGPSVDHWMPVAACRSTPLMRRASSPQPAIRQRSK